MQLIIYPSGSGCLSPEGEVCSRLSLFSPLFCARAWRCLRLGLAFRVVDHFHFSLSCTEDGSGNPLQCSCLENPRDGGAWWIAIDGVTQSRTRLKWLSSSSKDVQMHLIFCVLNPKLNSTMRNSYRAMTSYMPLTGSESTYRLRREDKRYSK